MGPAHFSVISRIVSADSSRLVVAANRAEAPLRPGLQDATSPPARAENFTVAGHRATFAP